MISVNGVSKSYGDVKALDSVTLTLGKGEAVAVLGPSGSGKSTLLRLVAGLETPDVGEILIDGAAVSSPGFTVHPRLRNLSVVFQTPALWPHMTVRENIMFTLEPSQEAEAQVDRLLVSAGLDDKGGRYPSQLSGGEARRVSLVRAIAPGKGYLLMDEPLVNLDEELHGEMLELIRSLRRPGVGILYVTHSKADAEVLCDRVIRLRKGRVE